MVRSTTENKQQCIVTFSGTIKVRKSAFVFKVDTPCGCYSNEGGLPLAAGMVMTVDIEARRKCKI